MCQCISADGPLCKDLRIRLGIESKSLAEIENVEMEIDVESDVTTKRLNSIEEESAEESMTISEVSIEELQTRVYANKSESSDVTNEPKESSIVFITKKSIK